MSADTVHSLDIIVILVYLAGMILFGVFLSRRVKNSEDFYLAGRSLGPFIITATVCASIIGGGAMIGRASIAYRLGALAIFTGVPYLIGMLVFSGISGRIHAVGSKYRISSIPGLMEYRFGKAAKYITALLVAYTMMATVGSQVTAMARILQTVGGNWGISYELGAFIGVVIFTSYTLFSGLFGVAYTDVAQFLILILMVYIALPIIVMVKGGGISEILSSVPKEYLSLRPDPYIIGIIFTNLAFTLAGAEMWQRAFAAKDAKTAGKGMFTGTSIYGVTIVITTFLGMGAYLLLPNLVQDYGSADSTIPALAITFLPVGLTGLTIAGFFAVLMSSADTYLLISVQTIIRDIGKTIFPGMSEKRELLLSRIFTLVLGLGAFLIAFYIRQAYDALMFAWTFYAASLGVPAFMALFWKKATKQGTTAGIAMGFGTSIVWKLLGEPLNLAAAIPGTVLCACSLIVVSLITFHPSTPAPYPNVRLKKTKKRG